MYPDSWRDKAIWPKSSQLEDGAVADIRAKLPYGPVSFSEAESHACTSGINPFTILNIASGRSYLRPKACPNDHPLRLALNAEIAAKQRLRYQAQKHRQAVGDAQNWNCRYCGRDVSGKGQSALDHIVPVARGGTSDKDNLQILCRRCNTRKGAKTPDERLDTYMDRKVSQDRIIEKLNNVLVPIIDSFIWADGSESLCPWCHAETKIIYHREAVHDSNVFQCQSCKRAFRGGGGWIEQSDFIGDIRYAVFSRYCPIVQAAMRDDLEQVKTMVQHRVGALQEVRKRRHTHASGECWCEYDDDPFRVIQNYTQTQPISEMKEADVDECNTPTGELSATCSPNA